MIGIAFLYMGCSSLVPTERKESRSVQATEALSTQHDLTVERATHGQQTPVVVAPQPNITVTGTNNTVSYQPPAAPTFSPQFREELKIASNSKNHAGTTEDARGGLDMSIPMFVKIIGLAIGIGALFFVLLWVWRSIKNTAAGQAIQAGDAALKTIIEKKRNEAMVSKDDAEIAKRALDIAELEKQRGILNSR